MKDEERPFTKASVNGFKLKEGGFRLDIRKKLYIMRVVRHCNEMPTEAVGCPIPGSILGQLVSLRKLI